MTEHRSIMLKEVVDALAPAPGEVAIDCTLGGGGHAEALLERLGPGGRLLALDLDRDALDQTATRLRGSGASLDRLRAHHANFATIALILQQEGLAGVDMVLADLGVSSMQADDPGRGFNYRYHGLLDMRMNVRDGERAVEFLARVGVGELEHVLREHADEPHASAIAQLIKRQAIETTHALERCIRFGLSALDPTLSKPAIKQSIRRTFQALRIAINDEMVSLDALLVALPSVLKSGGRVVFLTFHSGEDRRVKQAFRSGHQNGIYSAIARKVVQSSKDETRSNRRSSSAKLRWAIRA